MTDIAALSRLIEDLIRLSTVARVTISKSFGKILGLIVLPPVARTI